MTKINDVRTQEARSCAKFNNLVIIRQFRETPILRVVRKKEMICSFFHKL